MSESKSSGIIRGPIAVLDLVVKFFEIIGSAIRYVVEETGRISLVFSSCVYWGLKPPFRLGNIIRQMESIGVGSISIVVLTSVFTGMVLALQTSYALKSFGAIHLIGPAVVLSICRELGPVLTALMVTGRSGSAIAAELGTMRVTEQIDAMYAMAVNPVQYLIFPRVLAAIIVLPALALMFDFCGALGGYLLSILLLDVPPNVFIREAVRVLDWSDIYIGLIKATVFGLCLSVVGCYKGFYVFGGAAGVGRATTESVVMSSVLILVSDYFLTALLY